MALALAPADAAAVGAVEAALARSVAVGFGWSVVRELKRLTRDVRLAAVDVEVEVGAVEEVAAEGGLAAETRAAGGSEDLVGPEGARAAAVRAGGAAVGLFVISFFSASFPLSFSFPLSAVLGE